MERSREPRNRPTYIYPTGFWQRYKSIRMGYATPRKGPTKHRTFFVTVGSRYSNLFFSLEGQCQYASVHWCPETSWKFWAPEFLWGLSFTLWWNICYCPCTRSSQRDVINVADQYDGLGDNEMITSMPRDFIMVMCPIIEGTVTGAFFWPSFHNCAQSFRKPLWEFIQLPIMRSGTGERATGGPQGERRRLKTPFPTSGPQWKVGGRFKVHSCVMCVPGLTFAWGLSLWIDGVRELDEGPWFSIVVIQGRLPFTRSRVFVGGGLLQVAF